MLIRLVVSGAYQNYVRSSMAPWLLLAGVALVVLGGLSAWLALRATPDHAEEGHAHDHDTAGWVRWLVIAPVAALLLVTPPALGSYGVSGSSVTVSAGSAVFSALPQSDRPRPMSLLEFGQRAVDRGGASFSGQVVVLTGFVAGIPAAGSGSASSFELARYQIACCAADGVAAIVSVSGYSGASPARDTWLRVIGAFSGVGKDNVPILTVTSVEAIPPPVDPYEST
jgi:uncharacterized repeat protein (TIGR03943 family)